MDQVIAARAQMGTSLAFHIVFAALGVGLPLLVVLAETIAQGTGDDAYAAVARTWAKGMAILFAVGAVSGTILSFELGLLWPGFMRFAGPIIGLPFSLEGFAFFIEAIFIGLYLYGWDRLTPRAHLLSGIPIVMSGPVSSAFVTLVNAWMQMPTGFRIVDGQVTDVHPLVAMFAMPWLVEVIHGTLGAYVFTGFATAGVCAFVWLRSNRQPRVLAGLRIAMTVAAIAIPLQIVMGDIIVRFDAEHEPAKFAALEVVRHTQRGAPLTLGGIPTPDGDITGAIEIPRLLSVLVAFDPNAEVPGLDRIAPNDRPPIAATHLSFDAMVGSGFALLALALAWAIVAARKRTPPSLLLAATAAGGFFAVVALEAGWFVTEFGRQPWIAVGLQRTSAAVTPAPHLEFAFAAFSGIYVVLAAMCWWLLRRIGRTA